MKRKNLREYLLFKVSPLMDIVHAPIRRKNEEEEKRYTERRKKALQYVGELVSSKNILDTYGSEGNLASEETIETFRKIEPDKIEELFVGDFVKIYRFRGQLYMILASVKDIKSFK